LHYFYTVLYIGEVELCIKKNLEHEKYPAQMLEVAGDLRQVPAKFENPAAEQGKGNSPPSNAPSLCGLYH